MDSKKILDLIYGDVSELYEAIRHDLINALGHIYDEDANAAMDLTNGIILAAKQLQN